MNIDITFFYRNNDRRTEDFPFDEEKSLLTINDNVFDLSLLIENDKQNIVNDVNSKKFASAFIEGEIDDRYENYDVKDIKIDRINIFEDFCIEVNYTINAGTYRRSASGVMAPIHYKATTPEGTIIICPKYYSGKVCW